MVKTEGCRTLFNAQDHGWSVAITMETSDKFSWKWRKLRHVFGDTLSCQAGPPVIWYRAVICPSFLDSLSPLFKECRLSVITPWWASLFPRALSTIFARIVVVDGPL